jgi:ubiquinone/menaquinone biosynthesis C-methylase UbiE
VHEPETTSPEDEYRARTFANWEAAAPGWERERDHLSRTLERPTGWMLERLALRPGQTVLELAAGPGDAGLQAAARVGPRGRVILSDRSPAMVAAAARRAAELGIGNVDTRVIDVERIDLADGAVDAVLCRCALMLVPDPACALAEIRRVLRPGGRMAVMVWAAAEHNPWATALWDAVERFTDLPPAAPGGPGMFALGDPDGLRDLAAAAGLDVIELDHIDVEFANPSFDDYWRVHSSLNGSLVRTLPQLGEADQAALAEAVRTAIERFRSDAGYTAPGRVLVLAAAAPGA